MLGCEIRVTAQSQPQLLALARLATDKAALGAPAQTTASVTNAWFVCS